MVRVLLFLSLLAAPAALAAPIGKTTLQKEAHAFGLSLPAPGGFCELTSNHPADRDMLAVASQMNAGHNRVLGIYADCGQLDAMRGRGAVLNDYAMYLAPMSADNLPPDITRSELLDVVAGALEGTDAFDKAEDVVRDRLSQADAAIELQDLVNLGPLHRDEAALYTGILTRARQGGSDIEVTAVVIAMTLVGGRVVTLNLSAPYEGQPTIDTLLADQRANIDRLIAAN